MRIGIAGAGLMGCLVGWRLARAGHDVTLCERASRTAPASAAHIAAAMIAPMSELPDSEPEVARMGWTGLSAWPGWLKELDVPHAFEGAVAVAHRSDEALLDAFERILLARSPCAPQRLDRDRLEQVEAELAPVFHRGLFLAEEGWIDNRALLAALETRCGHIEYGVDAEAELLQGDALRRFDRVLDCRGADAGEPGLRGVRGEVARLRAPEVRLRRPVRLMHPRYQLYVAPRGGDEYVVGATQIESESRGPVTVRSALELLSAAFSLHTGFAEAEILELNAGLRAAFDDNVPRVYWRQGVLRVNGLYRHGFLAAPAIVEAALAELGAPEPSTGGVDRSRMRRGLPMHAATAGA